MSSQQPSESSKDDKLLPDVLKNRPDLLLAIKDRILERKLKAEGASDDVLLDHHRSVFIRLIKTDKEGNNRRQIEEVMERMADLTDNLDGVNNYVGEILTLSNKCKNIRKAEAKLVKNPKKELRRLGLEGVLSESTEMPILLTVPPEFRIEPKKPEASFSKNQVDTVSRDTGKKYIFDYDGVTEAKYEQKSKGRCKRKREEDDSTTVSSQPKLVNEVKPTGFVSAKEVEVVNQLQKRTETMNHLPRNLTGSAPVTPFINPMLETAMADFNGSNGTEVDPNDPNALILADPRLRSIDKSLAQKILHELVDHDPKVSWEDIAGLEVAKKRIEELVVYPMQKPELFKGLTAPGKGVLLFGPPGNGKTMIGKCIASQAKATFFSITASALTSKWVGEGEKMVRAMFLVARVMQPSVIFIDEIDSLLLQRSDTDQECSTRMKTEFLCYFDGLDCKEDDRLLIIGATNRPQALDEAARRRFSKRLYIPLPDFNARLTILNNLLREEKCDLTAQDKDSIAEKTHGYSGSDMSNLCKEAALCTLRTAINAGTILQLQSKAELRAITLKDFEDSLELVKPSVSSDEIGHYENFNKLFGAIKF